MVSRNGKSALCIELSQGKWDDAGIFKYVRLGVTALMANNGQATVMHDDSRVISVVPKTKTEPPLVPEKEAHTLMARLDAKGSEEITLRRSTLWFIGTALVLAAVLFSYGSSMFAWVRDDQDQRNGLNSVKQQVGDLNRQMDELRGEVRLLTNMLQDLRVKEAEKRGYQLKSAEGEHK